MKTTTISDMQRQVREACRAIDRAEERNRASLQMARRELAKARFYMVAAWLVTGVTITVHIIAKFW